MRISVLGCGWLGLPLAQHLLDQGHTLKGSTTSVDKLQILKQSDITPFKLKLPGDIESDDFTHFLESDLLFLNIPPSRKSSDVTQEYPEVIRSIADKVKESSVEWVIFASSTSVYDSTDGIYSEEDTEEGKTSRPSGSAVLKAEYILQDYSSSFQTTILRFGGLYGYNRHPVRYLAGRKNISDPSKPVNLVHQDDCIRVVSEIIKKEKKGTIYNVVSDGHPPRQTLYTSAAEHFGVEPPEFGEDTGNNHRIISNKKLKEELEYLFLYPNPLDHAG